MVVAGVLAAGAPFGALTICCVWVFGALGGLGLGGHGFGVGRGRGLVGVMGQ